MAEPNILNNYASFNCLWSMAAVSKGDFNSGAYRKDLTNIVFSSAGRYEGKRVATAYGIPEFFIDNIVMETYVTPTSSAGNTNQIKVDFEIFEPFSMGLFLQSLQVAAKQAGYSSYLDDCPYVLQLDIVGQNTFTEFSTAGQYWFCIRLSKCGWTTDESGSRYKVEAIPYGDQGFNASSNTLQNDIKIVAKGAKEALLGNSNNSFVTMMNEREAQLVKDQKKEFPSKYTVEFVKPDWGGENPFENDGAGGNFDFSAESPGGTENYKRAGEVYNSNGKVQRDKVSINPREKAIQFSKDTALTSIIDGILINTRHARDTASNKIPLDAEGNRVWWRTDIDVKLLEYDKSIKEHAKEYVFRIVPFKIHHSVYLAGESKSQGVNAIRGSIAKKYYYIYTGLNTEVLKFNIEIQNFFFTAVDGNKSEQTGVQANPGVQQSVAGQPDGTRKPVGNVTENEPEGKAPATKPYSRAGNSSIQGGAGRMDTAQKIANEFYVNILNHVGDMINLDLEIVGDPYWLPTAGQPNVHPAGGGSMTNADGTMNYENRDIFVEVIFRTPLDTFGGDGLYKFQDGEEPSPWSGIYRMNKVINTWKDGFFTQKLEGNRMPAQDLQGDGEIAPTVVDKPVPEKNTLYKN